MKWNVWVKSIRNGSHLTLKEVVTRMGCENFSVTSMSDVERGYRKFKSGEFEAWKHAFPEVTVPLDIPLADAASEKARLAARQNRKNKKGRSRAELAERAEKIVNNPYLTFSQVESLLQTLHLEASKMLGL